MIIAFSWTTPSLLVRAKTCTRRSWEPTYARKFKPGDLVKAYDRSPRVGGKHVATIRILSVTREWGANMPDSDFEAEGFAWLAEHPDQVPKNKRHPGFGRESMWQGFVDWRDQNDLEYVVRFEVVEVV